MDRNGLMTAFSIMFFVLLSLTSFDSALAQQEKLKMGYAFGPAHLYHMGAMKFADKVREDSKGEIKIDPYPSGQIVPYGETLKALQSGVIDLAIIPTRQLSSGVPEFQVLALPMIVGDARNLYRFLNGVGQAKIASSFDSIGLKNMAWFDSGFLQVLSRTKILSISDFKNLKVGTKPVPYNVAFFQKLNAVPIEVKYPEVYSALKSGVIDAFEAPLRYKYPLIEQTKYVALTSHEFLLASLAINRKSFEKLGPEHQNILLDAASESGHFERRSRINLEVSEREKISGMGIEIIPLDRANLRKTATPIFQSFKEKEPALAGFMAELLSVGNGTRPCDSDECRCDDGNCHPETDECCQEIS